MQKVLITGGAGLAGQALLRSSPDDVEVSATWRTSPLAADTAAAGAGAGLASSFQVDLCSEVSLGAIFDEAAPDLVIHTAYTQASQADIVDATTNVATNCARVGARLIHLSSDCVFGGEMGPYDEVSLGGGSGSHVSSSDVDPPVDDYGRWKATVERTVEGLVPDASLVRTSLLVSLDPIDPRTAVVIDGLNAGTDVKLFVDELRCPLSVHDLAEALWRVVATERSAAAGVWHLAGSEALSRYSLGVLIAASWGLDPTGIQATLQRDHPQPRARDIRLSTARACRELGFRPQTMAELFTGPAGADLR